MRLPLPKLTASLLAGLAATLPGLAAAADPDTLVIAQSVDIESFEPDGLNVTPSINVARHLFGTLLSVTPEGKIVPNFAESYAWNEAGTELSFKIRDGLTCEDGEPLTAEDVVYSLQRAADPANGFRGNTPGFIYPSIGYKGAHVAPGNIAVLEVAGYSSTVPGMMAQVFIHCRDSYQKMTADEARTHPVASGPYKLVEWVKDDHVLLTRNPDYTLAPPPFRNILFKVMPEASTRTAELMAGNVDIAVNIPPDQAQAVDATGTARVVPVAGTRRIFAGFNLSPAYAETEGGKAIRDVRVRQALNLAVDVPTICQTLLSTDCTRMAGPANAGDPDSKPYPYDPKAAEALLDAAGYPRGKDGVRFHLRLQGPNNRYLNDALVEQAVAQYLSDVGVATSTDLMAMTLFSPKVHDHQAGELYFIGQGGATWSAIYDMSLFPSCDSPVNNGMWCNPDWMTLWASLSGIRDPGAERETVNRMLRIFHDDAPWIMLYFQPDFYGVSDRIRWSPRRDEAIEGWTATLSDD